MPENGFQRTLPQATWSTGPNTVKTRTTPPLPYLLITFKVKETEKVSLSCIKNPRTVS